MLIRWRSIATYFVSQELSLFFRFLGAEVAFSASILSLILAQPAPNKLGATWRYPVLLITGYRTDAMIVDAFPGDVS